MSKTLFTVLPVNIEKNYGKWTGKESKIFVYIRMSFTKSCDAIDPKGRVRSSSFNSFMLSLWIIDWKFRPFSIILVIMSDQQLEPIKKNFSHERLRIIDTNIAVSIRRHWGYGPTMPTTYTRTVSIMPFHDQEKSTLTIVAMSPQRASWGRPSWSASKSHQRQRIQW